MELIQKFISQYEEELDFYEALGKLAERRIKKYLKRAGIKAIVTSRAKDPVKLKYKVVERNKEKEYATLADIYEDIVDLAGVRIALYFPTDLDFVDEVIRERFNVIKHKSHPDRETESNDNSDSAESAYDKRFMGYRAEHYHVKLSNKYSDAKLEIQVASVLMHAWAEVEHDLIYKATRSVSEREYAIADIINGLVLAGEIALEQLKKEQDSLEVSEIMREDESSEMLPKFIMKWIELEKLVRQAFHHDQFRPLTAKELKAADLFDDNLIGEFIYIRNARNAIVHGTKEFSAEELKRYNEVVSLLIEHVKNNLNS